LALLGFPTFSIGLLLVQSTYPTVRQWWISAIDDYFRAVVAYSFAVIPGVVIVVMGSVFVRNGQASKPFR